MGYVDLPLIFTTDQGPIRADVEACIVKGMTTPLILGNDFADQYSLSIIRNNGESLLKFAGTRRTMKLENSTSDSCKNLEVQTFLVKVKKLKHKIKYSIWQKEKKHQENSYFIAQNQETIPPFSARNITYEMKGSKTRNSYYLQINKFESQGLTPLQVTNSIVTQTEGTLYTCSNSDCPIEIYKGEVLRKVIKMENLDGELEKSSLEQITAFTHLTQAMMKAYQKDPEGQTKEEMAYAERQPDQPSGPKTAEVLEFEDVLGDQLISALGINSKLTCD